MLFRSMQKGTGNNFRNTDGQFGPEKMLDNLTAQGYDVAAISAAVTSGNYETAHTLMQELRTKHPDAFPTPREGAGICHMGGQRWAQK